MRAALLTIVLFLAGAAVAAPPVLVMGFIDGEGQPGRLRLHDATCKSEKVLGFATSKFQFNSGMFLQLRRSVITWKGKDYESCWIEIEGRVFSIDDGGDLLRPPLNKREFKEEGV